MKAPARHAPVARWARLVALTVLALILGSRLADAADPPGRYQGVFGSANYLISVPPDWNGASSCSRMATRAKARESARCAPRRSTSTCANTVTLGSPRDIGAEAIVPNGFSPSFALRERVIKEFGAPRRTIIHGQSMGGHIAIASLSRTLRLRQRGTRTRLCRFGGVNRAGRGARGRRCLRRREEARSALYPDTA